MSLFKIKTSEGYTFKVLAELLQNSLKECCFICKPTGIYLTSMDTKYKNGSKLICLSLLKERFTLFKLNTDELQLGLNLIHFYKMLKSIKRKDTLILSIEKDDPTKLVIHIEHPGEKNPIIKHINITKIQPVVVVLPDENIYPDPIVATTKEFQKLKTLNKMSKYILVTILNKVIKFFCDKDGVYSTTVEFGETEDENEDDEIYSQKFLTEEIIQLIKVAGLSQTIQIYFGSGLPLKIKLHIGNLGILTIYIKSQEDLENVEECEDKNDSD